MLSISSKCRYGLAALLDLAAHYGQGLLQIKEIATRNNLPPQYLEQIFNRLVKAGLIRGVRGSRGGYELATSPSAVSVLTVIKVLEGGIELAPAPGDRIDAINELFGQAEHSLRTILDVNLASLLLRQQALRNTPIYHI